MQATKTATPIEFVAPAGTPMAGQKVGVELMLALAVARVVQAKPALLPELRAMQSQRNKPVRS